MAKNHTNFNLLSIFSARMRRWSKNRMVRRLRKEFRRSSDSIQPPRQSTAWKTDEQ